MTHWLLIAAVLTVGCGWQPKPDFYVDGVGVKIETTKAWATMDDFPKRFQNTIETAATFAGGSYGDLRGWVVVITDDWSQCNGDGLDGCTHQSPDDWMSITVSRIGDCVEQTLLVHEVVHAIIGDQCHGSAIWRDFSRVQQELNATNPTRPLLNGASTECYLNKGNWEVSTPTCH